MKIAELNKKEREFLCELNTLDGHIINEARYDEEILFYRRLKTFIRELEKIERKHDYYDGRRKEYLEGNICYLLSYVGADRFEHIEEFIYCFKNNLKEGAQAYFNYFY